MDLYLLCLIIIIYSWFISSWNFFKIINVTSISITYKYIVLNKNILYINNKLNFIFNLENEYSVHIYDKFKYTWRRHWESKRRYQLSKGTARRTHVKTDVTRFFDLSLARQLQSSRHMYPKYWYTLLHFITFWLPVRGYLVSKPNRTRHNLYSTFFFFCRFFFFVGTCILLSFTVIMEEKGWLLNMGIDFFLNLNMGVDYLK